MKEERLPFLEGDGVTGVVFLARLLTRKVRNSLAE
jgi:hypothetical protein